MTAPVPFYDRVAPPSANTSNNAPGAPGSPQWWLYLLTWRLMARQYELDIREDYVEGNHPLPDGDRRYVKALRELQQLAQTNYIGMVTAAPVERMHTRGFRFGPVGQADQDAQDVWSANDMELQETLIHSRAAKYGLTYVIINPPELPDGLPVVTAETPRTCITYQDPLHPTRSIAGLKLWADDVSGHIRAVLFLPDMIYGLEGPPITVLQNASYDSIRDHLIGTYGNGLQFVGSTPNEIGEVPMVQYTWRPDSGDDDDLPAPECGIDLQKIQNRINQTVLHRLIVSNNQAYRQRYASGLKIPKGRKGQKKPPFDPGADALWVTENPDAKFGEFGLADVRQILEEVRDDVIDMASISRTPAHYLMGRMANVSGDTLSQAEAGLNSKTGARARAVGWGHVRTIRVCFLYMGLAEKAKEVTGQCLWSGFQQMDMAEAADAALKWNQIGVPLELIMEKQGWSPDEIEFAVKKAEEKAQQELDLQQQQMQMQHDQAMELAKAGGGPEKPKPSTPPTK